MSSESSNKLTSSGKKAEFETYVKKNMRRAYFTAFGLLGSHDAAMDISQEAFIRAYRNFNRFDKRKNFFTWYYKILKNLCLNFIRDNKRKNEEVLLEYRTEADEENQPQQSLEREEMKKLLQKAISELEFSDREIIILKEFEEHSYNEISEMLNIPVGTVMSRLFYARKKLGQKMKRMMK